MPDYRDLARQRVAAVEALQDQLIGNLSAAQQALYEALLQRLTETYDDPEQLLPVLAEFTQAVHLPVLVAYGESLLRLVELNLRYVEAVGATQAQRVALRAPLTTWLQRTYGLDVQGQPVAGGYLASLLQDDAPARQLRLYAYQSQLRGAGLAEYREGLKALVVGHGEGAAGGLYQQLYQQAPDQFAAADRLLQEASGARLGWQAALYSGGLIVSSRPFCVARDGKVFLRSEIEKFGTSADKYPGYSNKAAGEFAGKTELYSPFTNAGGYSCRHSFAFLGNAAAMRLRPELKEDENGNLYIAD